MREVAPAPVVPELEGENGAWTGNLPATGQEAEVE